MSAYRRVLIIAACAAFAGQTTASAEPVDTAFTYQGQLKQSGNPVDGLVDMRFALFTAAIGGAQVGDTLFFDGVKTNPGPVDVLNGLFTVELDFGVEVFNGD